MYFVSCARILARCHIQIVYSRRQQPNRFAPKWDAGSTPATPAGTPSTPTLPGCVPVHLAASLCWRPLFEWHLNLCVHPNLARFIVRSAGAAICCCSDELYDRRLHYAMPSLCTHSTSTSSSSRCYKDQYGIRFWVYSKLENWISSSCNWNWNFSFSIWIITI